MDKIKNLGWPYNIYSAITGLSVPDTQYMKSRLYLYKYQRGYYCFFMIPPDRAHQLMSEYFTRYVNERRPVRVFGLYNETSLLYKDYLHRLFMYIVLVHRYAYNRSYDEILYMFYNDLDSFASFLSDRKSIMPLLESVRDTYKICNKRQLHKYEANALNSLRKNPAFNTYFLAANTWILADVIRPGITERLTVNDKIKLYSLHNKAYRYNENFTIKCRQFYNYGLAFDTELSHIIEDARIVKFLYNYNMPTIGSFCKRFTPAIAARMYLNDIVVIFKCLKRNGFKVRNEFYEECIRSSIIERVSKKKFCKRIIHEVKFVTTTCAKENKKDGDKKESTDQETALKTIMERAQREKNNRERYRYYQKLLLESRENEAYPNYADIVYYIDKLIPFVREYMNKSKPVGYKLYDPYRDYGFIDGNNTYINISGIYTDICSEYLDEFGYEFPLSEDRVFGLLVKEGAMSRAQLDLPEGRKSTRKYRKTCKTTYSVTEDSLIKYRDNLMKSDTGTNINVRRGYRADPNYHRGNKPQYIDTFSNMATLRDIEDYYDTPECIDVGFLESIGIHCELPYYDQ